MVVGAASGRPDQDLEVPFSEVNEKLRDVLERQGVAIVTDVIDANELRTWSKPSLQIFPHWWMTMRSALATILVSRRRTINSSAMAFVHFRTLRRGRFSASKALSCRAVSLLVTLRGACAGTQMHAAFAAAHPLDAGPLVTSIDVTFFSPEGGPKDDIYKGSAHTDQNSNDTREPNLGGASVYQGILYVWPAGEGCTTTCVWPGSHKAIWPRMMKDAACVAAGPKGDHYCELKNLDDNSLREELLAGWNAHMRKLTIPAGALLLWNSRTVHTGWKGGPRFAQAVCLEPAAVRPAAQRLSKLRLAALGLPSTHWARIGHQHDVLPVYTGWFESKPAAEAKGHDESSEVVLPLRPAIRPAALADDADLDALKALAKIDWTQSTHHCVWSNPPEEHTELLEASVKEEFKPFL